jgi:hypothetical protein
LPADVVAGDVEVVGFREVAEAFLAVEVVFREEVAIFLEVREVFPEVAAVSLAVAVLLIAAVFLAVVVVSPEAQTVFPVVQAGAFQGAAIVLLAEAVAVPLDITVLRTILRCSPISADRDRVAVECHRVQSEVNPATVHQWEEALHNYRPEIDSRKSPLAMKAPQEHVQVMFHPNAQVGAMPAIFSASPAGSGPALRSAAQPQITLANSRRIVLAAVNGPLLHSNAQIGTRVR